jgi:hypothetical protein
MEDFGGSSGQYYLSLIRLEGKYVGQLFGSRPHALTLEGEQHRFLLNHYWRYQQKYQQGRTIIIEGEEPTCPEESPK